MAPVTTNESDDTRLITMAEAAAELPGGKSSGKPRTVACVRRWTEIGCFGIKLWGTWIGQNRYTTRKAIREFLQRLNDRHRPGPKLKVRTPKQRARDHARAEDHLDAIGCGVGSK